MTSQARKIVDRKVDVGMLKLAQSLVASRRPAKFLVTQEIVSVRFKELYDNGGDEALKEISMKKPVVQEQMRACCIGGHPQDSL